MCRNIKTLFNFEPPATNDEIHAAAVQFVRKISGSTKPCQANSAPFEHAVAEIEASVSRLLDTLVTAAPRKDRETEFAKSRERSARRFGATGTARGS